MIKGLIIVAVCRNEEVPVHHEFAGALRTLEDERKVRITHVQVANFSISATNQLVANVLQQPEGLCTSLTDKLDEKTKGNVFCLLQLLRALYQGGILKPEVTHQQQQQWVWDDRKWNDRFRDGDLDVIDLVTSHLKSLSLPCHMLLQTAAFLGTAVEINTLRVLLADQNCNDQGSVELEQAIAETIEKGFLRERPYQETHYAFCHDKIQQGAYGLVPKHERNALHLAIGRTLYQNLLAEELHESIFLVVNQMIHGASIFTEANDKYVLANLCLQAGKKSTRSSDFHTAIKHFQNGIEMLALRC